MGLFDNILKGNESLFLDEIALDFDYIPKVLKHRENEQQYVATCIKPLLQERSGRNLFITGKPGIGKTTAINWVLRELGQETNDVYPIFINCWKHDSTFKIVNYICEKLGYTFTHNKKTDELMNNIASIINKKAAVFVFDEVDKLQEPGIIYNLFEEINKKTIILITNDENYISELDPRIKSRLLLDALIFKPYNFEETKSILKERRDFAFAKNVWEEEAFENIVKKSYELRDIRTGLHLMKEAGVLAENSSSKKINIEHTTKIIENLKAYKLKDSTELTEDQKITLSLIKENSGKSIKELHEIYEKRYGQISYRTFFDRIKQLEKIGNITTKTKEGPGNSNIVTYGTVKKLNEF